MFWQCTANSSGSKQQLTWELKNTLVSQNCEVLYNTGQRPSHIYCGLALAGWQVDPNLYLFFFIPSLSLASYCFHILWARNFVQTSTCTVLRSYLYYNVLYFLRFLKNMFPSGFPGEINYISPFILPLGSELSVWGGVCTFSTVHVFQRATATVSAGTAFLVLLCPVIV
jgi:hypothetical protein